jgi:hypothetical protein
LAFTALEIHLLDQLVQDKTGQRQQKSLCANLTKLPDWEATWRAEGILSPETE